MARSGRLLSTMMKVLLVGGVEGGAAAQSVGFWWGCDVGFKRVGWLDELDVTGVAKVAHDVTALTGVNIAWIVGPWPWHISTSPRSILKAVLGRRPIGSSRIPIHIKFVGYSSRQITNLRDGGKAVFSELIDTDSRSVSARSGNGTFDHDVLGFYT